MTELSLSANLAWQLAAQEAAASRSRFIEPEHILIGICSLEKLLMPEAEAELDPPSRQALQSEQEAIEDILRGFELDPTQLRRSVRKELGEGKYTPTEKIMHRSPACKRAFERASALAVSALEVTCIHLLAAVLEQPPPAITSVLEAAGVKPSDLREHAHQRLKVLEGG